MKPPFPYYGGKTRLARRIAEHLPEHLHYVEPFAGSLAVLLAKEPSKAETVNDLDHELMTFWRVLRDQPEELIRVCEDTPYSRAEHLAARDREGLDELELARRVWVTLSQSRGGGLTATGWRFSSDGSRFPEAGRRLAYLDRIREAAGRIRAVALECLPAIDLIGRYDHPTICLYVDPPYLASTRGPAQRYSIEMGDDSGHLDLAMALHETKSSVVLSGFDSPLYESLYGDWTKVNLGDRSTRGNLRTAEILWIKDATNAQSTLDGLGSRRES